MDLDDDELKATREMNGSNNKNIIKVDRNENEIVVTVRKAVSGDDILNSIEMLISVLFTNENFKKIDTLEQIEIAFKDLKEIYIKEYMKELL